MRILQFSRQISPTSPAMHGSRRDSADERVPGACFCDICGLYTTKTTTTHDRLAAIPGFVAPGLQLLLIRHHLLHYSSQLGYLNNE
jgi:hypothetical protein